MSFFHRRKSLVAVIGVVLIAPVCMALCCAPNQCLNLGPWPPQVSAGSNLMIPMPDGTRLITDIYVPAGGGPWPVIMHRTPYDPEDWASEAHARNAANFTEGGIAYVVQNSRGHFGSEGARDMYGSDQQDGRAMLKLLAAQPWCNGKIMMRGHSAPGITSYMAAPDTDGSGVNLTAAWPAMATPDIHAAAFVNGILRKKLSEGWLESTNQSFLLPEAVANATNDAWWASRSIVRDYALVKTPMVHVTGWFDIFTKDQIGAFVGIQQAGAPSQYLIVGPWTHNDIEKQQQGEMTFPANATLGTYALFEEFGLFHLLGQGDLSAWPIVRYYTMGDVDDAAAPGNEWRTANTWPPFAPNPQTFYLHTGGLLDQTVQGAGEAADQYDYDPNDPVPTVGGNNMLIAAGPHDQQTIEARADVLTYTTAPLASPLEATGAIQAKVFLQCSTPDTDLIVRLSDVYPDGRSMIITEGALRLRFRNPAGPADGDLMTPGQTYEIDLALWPTSIVFNTGHRIRIAITSSSDPRLDPNPNTGDALRANSNTQVATVTILHDAANQSTVVFPSP